MTAALTALVDEADRWFRHHLIHSPTAKPARDYLADRGFTRGDLEEFGVGWAPAGWDELVTHLGADAAEITKAGLGYVNRSGRLQDFFRGRIMFPIHDLAGQPVGFGGRLLPGDEGPKYLNSPDSALYRKSEVLYGLHRAAAKISDTGTAVLCEGYLDVIAAQRVGIGGAVASCGTALGSEHLKTLRLVADRAVLAFDPDDAGRAAVARIGDLDGHGLEVLVASLPDGVDPAALAATDPDRLRAAIDNAEPMLSWLVNRTLADGGRDSIEQRVRTAERALEVIARHPSRLAQDELMMGVATRLTLDPALLRQRLDETRQARPRRDRVGADLAVEQSGVSELELAALGVAIHGDRSEPPWWFRPEVFDAATARSVVAAMTTQHGVAIDTGAPLDAAGQELVAHTSAPIGVDVDEVGVRLVRAALQRHASSTETNHTTLTSSRQQLHSLSTATGADQVAAAKAGLALLIGR